MRRVIVVVYGLLLGCIPLTVSAKPLAQLETDQAKVVVHQNRVEIYAQGRRIIALKDLVFNYHPLTEWQVTATEGREIRITGVLPADVDYYRTAEDVAPRLLTVAITPAYGGLRFHAEPAWGQQVDLVFDYLDDHFFGLSAPLQPNNQLSPDLTGSVVDVDIKSEGATLYENYASAFSAFYMSSHGYGSFFDTFASGRYQFAINGENRIHHDTGTLDWYILPGADGRAIHKKYFDLIGAPKALPLWALGPIGWRDENKGGAEEILADVQRLTDMAMPFTAWFVDRPYSDGAHAWSAMNFSESFKQPETWISRLDRDYHLKFMTWVSPATFGDQVFSRHLAGKFSYLDLSDTDTVKAYQARLAEQQYSKGVVGHKIDRADEALPLHEPWADETPVAERRNRYSYLMAKVHHNALEALFPGANVTFARSAIHRSQPYLSAIWGGDPRTTFSGLRANFANAARSAFMGFPVWGTDVGGYQGEGFIPENLYSRWLQAGSMTGLFEIKLDGAGGSGRDRMPWQYDDAFQQRFRAILEDRMALLPYLHSLANNAANNGVLMKPLAYVHLQDKNTWSVWDTFYLGDAILTAPVFDTADTRTVYLPEGRWREFDQPGKTHIGGHTITVPVTLDSLPRFIRENSIFVTGDSAVGNVQRWHSASNAVTLHFNPAEKAGEQVFDYLDSAEGQYKPIRQSLARGVFTAWIPALSTPAKAMVYRDKAPRRVSVNGKLVTVVFDPVVNALTVPLPDNTEVLLEIR